MYFELRNSSKAQVFWRFEPFLRQNTCAEKEFRNSYYLILFFFSISATVAATTSEGIMLALTM